ncbi:MAG: sigma-70 family RNA polymerase sigma factor [Gemmataceae bacterium]
MSTGRLADGVRALGLLTRPPDPRPDSELVAGFAATGEEVAFAELVRRHGPTVYGVCRRVLGNGHDADDAFQAVWLVFARRPGRVRPPGAVGAFLYGVAVKVATKARAQAAKRRQRLMAAAKPDRADDRPDWSDLGPVLDAELAALPEKYRQAVVLCDLTGKSRSEAAAALGWPEGTVAARVAKGRELLAARLRKRGITLSAAALGGLLTPEATACPVPAALQSLALDVLATDAVIPHAVQLLAEGAVRPMKTGTLAMLAAGLLTAAGLTAGAMLGGNGDGKDWERPPGGPAAIAADPPPGGPWRLVATLKDHGQMVYDAAFAPDGQTFATAGADGTVIVWDTATLKPRYWKQATTNRPPAGGGNPPPLGLRYQGADGLVAWYAAGAKTDEKYLDPADGKTNAVVTGTDRPLAAGGGVGVYVDGRDYLAHRLYDRQKAVRLDLPRPDGTETGLAGVSGWAVSPDGRLVAAGELYVSIRSKLRLLDAATGKAVVERPLFDADTPNTLAFAADGKRLAVSTGGGRLAVFAGPDWAEAYRHADPLVRSGDALAFTPDGRQLISAGYREEPERNWLGLVRATVVHREIRVRDAATGALVQSVPVREPAPLTDGPSFVARFGLDVSRLAVSPDGRTLVATFGSPYRGGPGEPATEQVAKAAAGEVRVYVKDTPAPPAAEYGPWELQAVLKDHGDLVYGAAFAPDGKTFSTIGADSTLTVWDAATRAKKHSYPVKWDRPADPNVVSPPPPPGARQGVKLPPWRWLQYLPDGTLFVTAQAGGGIDYHLLDPASGARLDEGELPGNGRSTGIRLPGVLAMSADGSRMLLGGGSGLRINHRGPGRGNDAAIEKSAAAGIVGTPWLPTAYALNRDGTRLAVVELIVNRDKNEVRYVIRICDADTGKTAATLTCDGNPYAVAWSPDGKWLAAACGPEARLWATGDWTADPVLWKPPYMNAYAVAFTPDSRQMLLGYWQSERGFWSSKLVNKVGAWSLPGMKHEQYLDVNPDEGVIGMAVSPDGRTLVAAVGNHQHTPDEGRHADREFRRKNGEVRVFTRKPIAKPAPPKAEEKPKADDGPERNQDLWVWQQRIIDPAKYPQQFTGEVRQVAFSTDGTRLFASGSGEYKLPSAGRSVTGGTILAWDVARTRPTWSHHPFADARGQAAVMAVSPDGRTLAVTYKDGYVRLLSATEGGLAITPNGEPIRDFQPATAPKAMAFSPDGQRLAHTDGRTLLVRDLGRSGEVQFGPMAGTPKDGDLPAAVAFSPDGKRVLFLSNDKIDPAWAKAAPPGSTADPAKATHHFAQIWGAGSGEAMAMLVHGTAPVTAVAWSANGKRIATADDKGEVVIWDGETFKEVKRLKLTGPVTALVLRADGQRFAAAVNGPPAKPGDGEFAARVQVYTEWEPNNWLSSSAMPVGPGAVVRSVAFSPDGKVLAAGGTDGLHVWDRVKVAPK